MIPREFLAVILSMMVLLLSCAKDNKSKSTRPISQEELNRETAEDVSILYSDSAKVQMRIKSPKMFRHTENHKTIEEFPIGILVEFFDDNQNISSWLEADYAIRKESDEVILIKNNVVLYNKRKDKLETEELIYDSKNSEIYTDKFVKITQPMSGDTSYGYGFQTDEEFNRFEMNIYSGIKKVEELEKILGSQ